MTSQEGGKGKGEEINCQVQHAETEGCNPRNSALSPEFLQRVRWRCRRGLLELDIVLGRFVEVHYAHLSESELQDFDVFLDMADNPLWDLISGRLGVVSGQQAALLEKIKSV